MPTILRGWQGYMERGFKQTAKLAFGTGFPDNTSVALQQLPSVEKIEMTELIATVRVLERKQSQDPKTVGAVTHMLGGVGILPNQRLQGAI